MPTARLLRHVAPFLCIRTREDCFGFAPIPFISLHVPPRCRAHTVLLIELESKNKRLEYEYNCLLHRKV